ncbi:hypothetical protein E2542_SST24588 [Spatholobus suberectus]|nr:hypothetical protein E2542_SST24588 [Spatholobus suberectus]
MRSLTMASLFQPCSDREKNGNMGTKGGQTMSELPFLGPQPGHVDILVHFVEKGGQPNKIGNVDPDVFSIFDAHDLINLLVKDEGLPPCYPFVLWWRSVNNGKILLLELTLIF